MSKTLRALLRSGLFARFPAAAITAGDLLSVVNFGTRALLDFMCLWEAAADRRAAIADTWGGSHDLDAWRPPPRGSSL